jgi:SAM-dependent methyltransferase
MYLFDNAAPQAPARLSALAAVFDPGTIRHLEARGTTDGWSCLEVGGGLGTMTRWLASRVGPRGRVLTTDIDTRHLDQLNLANVEVRRHDVVEDSLPAEAFDLAYTRLVLEHLESPQRGLANIVQAVKPGGWVVVEDFELTAPAGVGDDGAEPLLGTLAAMRHVSAAAGVDQRMGRSLSRRLRSCGLEQVTSEARTFLWRGGSVGAELMRLNIEQLREAILATKLVTAAEYGDDLARLDDIDLEVQSPTLWTSWGRRPVRE